jgi:hypothetical protein
MEMYYKPPTNKKKKWDIDFNKVWACPKCGILKIEIEEQGATNERC